jgi:hypothetical protein
MHALRIAFICLALVSAGCKKPVELKQALQVTDVSTGWFDAGIVDGRNKVVPSVTFKLKKTPGADLQWVALNGVFSMLDGQPSDLDDDIYVQRVDFSGDETPPITIQGKTGYTGDPPQSRADLLRHTQFRDMKVKVFVKQSSSQWVQLNETPIVRQLLTR